MNISYFVAKGMNKLGLSLKEVEEMPFVKLRTLLETVDAISGEHYYEMCKVVANPSLLKSKDGIKNYTKLFDEYKERISKGSVYEEAAKVDKNMLEIFKNQLKGVIQ